MIILGVDPGSRVAGYGLIELSGNKLNYLESGTIRFDCSTDFFSRLLEIHQQVSQLEEKWDIEEVALESLIYTKNVNSLIKLSQARAAMITAFSKINGSSFFEYAPNKIKSAISGFGHSDKLGLQKALKMLLNRKIECSSDDEVDALAIACCHALMKGRNFKISGGRSLSRKSGSLQSSVNLKNIRGRL